jgi:hypothetical protein
MRRLVMARATMVLACAAIVCGCSAILGDFTVGTEDGGADGGTGPGPDSGPTNDAGDGGGMVDVQAPDGQVPDSEVPDSRPPSDAADAADAIPDVLTIPDVGPPGNPGVAITSGGVFSKSAHFGIVGALGESPGGNLTAKSANYKLQSGVIGATQ